jgi:hypothetical protein
MSFIKWCKANPPDLPNIGRTEFRLAMKSFPEIIAGFDRGEYSTYDAYKRFYVLDKRYNTSGKWMASYTNNRRVPEFWEQFWPEDEEQRPYKERYFRK